MTAVGLAVVGAGMIGRRHAEHIAAEPAAELCAIVDPAPAGREVAASHGAQWFPGLDEMLKAVRPDGIIIATPNQMHEATGLEALAAGLAGDRREARRGHGGWWDPPGRGC